MNQCNVKQIKVNACEDTCEKSLLSESSTLSFEPASARMLNSNSNGTVVVIGDSGSALRVSEMPPETGTCFSMDDLTFVNFISVG